ncbi:hypothetical protein ALC53_00281 [Atta colombica]|uniref:Uncharacterized protein n=1 Tax=Atta colombica TaxID=520822 RepID=A0A195BXG8_9HYME|nr:hypothetical protein ALC53_00281 [Atta colombica]
MEEALCKPPVQSSCRSVRIFPSPLFLSSLSLSLSLSPSLSPLSLSTLLLHGTSKKEKQGKGIERQKYVRVKGRDRGATRKKRGIRDFVCLPVRPSEPEGTSAAANLEEELGRETNTSAEKRRRERKGKLVRIVG